MAFIFFMPNLARELCYNGTTAEHRRAFWLSIPYKQYYGGVCNGICGS